MAGAAVLGRLTWRVATVVDLVDETPRTRTLVLDVDGWAGHRAGQHVDVRLTAVFIPATILIVWSGTSAGLCVMK